MESESGINGSSKTLEELLKWIKSYLEDPSSRRVNSSFFTKDIVFGLEACFQELEPVLKLRLIQALVSLPVTCIQEWKSPISSLIELARKDADEWVETIAEMYRDFPTCSSIHLTSPNENSFLNATAIDLQIILKRLDDSLPQVLPYNAMFTTHRSNMEKYSLDAPDIKQHFYKKPNPKYDTLINDLQNAVANPKSFAYRKNINVPSVPVKIRGTTKVANNFPMGAIPKSKSTSSNSISGSAPSTKREGGAVLIGISEIPERKKKRASTLATNKNQASATISQPRNDETTADLNDQRTNENEAMNLSLSPSTQFNSDSKQPSNSSIETLLNNANFPESLRPQFESIFKGANKLTMESMKVIASFLSGNKENPLEAATGNVVTMLLSETIENMDTCGVEQSFKVETYFEMNFKTLEWKRLRKTKLIK